MTDTLLSSSERLCSPHETIMVIGAQAEQEWVG